MEGILINWLNVLNACWARSFHVAAHLRVLGLHLSQKLPKSQEDSFGFRNSPFTAPLDSADFIRVRCSVVLNPHEGRQKENHCSPPFLTTGVDSKQRLKHILVYLEQQERKDTLESRSQQCFAWERGDSQLYLTFSRWFCHIPTNSYKNYPNSFFTACGITSSSVLNPVWLGAKILIHLEREGVGRNRVVRAITSPPFSEKLGNLSM